MASVAIRVGVFPYDTFEGTHSGINRGLAGVVSSRDRVDHSVSVFQRIRILDFYMSLVSLSSLQGSDNRDTCNVLYSVDTGNRSTSSAYIDLHRCPCDRIALVIVLAVGISHKRVLSTVICEITGDKLARLAVFCIESFPCVDVRCFCGINRPLRDLHLIVGSNTCARLVLKCRKCIQHHGIADIIDSVIADVHSPADVISRLDELAVRNLGD